MKSINNEIRFRNNPFTVNLTHHFYSVNENKGTYLYKRVKYLPRFTRITTYFDGTVVFKY